jgi:hypothetical protein
MPSLAELAYASWLADEELDRQRHIVRYREYYDGVQASFLTDRLREFLNIAGFDEDFRMNVCRAVVSAVTERLIVANFGVTDETLADWSNKQVWQANRMDARQGNVHEGVVRDGEYFVIIDKPAIDAPARFTPQQRYTDPQVDGDGQGCKAHYPDDDPDQPIQFASKRWTEALGEGKTRQRMTLYYPDRIEKYQIIAGAPAPFADEEGGAWPIAWMGKFGPLGIPVIHFRQPGLRSEISDAVYMQNAINKTLTDLLATSDLFAFPIPFWKGFIPTTDGAALKADSSNALKVRPGTSVATTRDANLVGVDTVPGQDPTPIVNMLGQLVMWLSVVTDTPTSRFQFTGQIAAEGTLKQQNETLLTKVRNRQTLFGNSWEDCMAMARRLDNTFGNAGLDETLPFSANWVTTQPRDDLDFTSKKNDLEMPIQWLWKEAGYMQEEIDQMLEMREAELAMKARVATLDLEPPIDDESEPALTRRNGQIAS